MFLVNSYYLKEDKYTEFQEWLLSDEFKKLMAEMEEETGICYVGTYWPILGFGDALEDWVEVPNWAALDKHRESKAVQKLWSRQVELDLIDGSRPVQSRVLRTTEDVRVTGPPKKEEE